MKKVMAISSSYCAGGAGIQADIKTITMLGCYASSVVTQLVAQNTLATQAIYEVPALFIAEQINSILSDLGTDVIKIGSIHNKEAIKSVSEELQKHPYNNIVIDPVFIAHTGSKIITDDIIESFIHNIIPLANIVTPNIYEAELLANMKIFTDEEAINAAKKIQAIGAKNILIKGGHMIGNEIRDILLLEDGNFKIFKHNRIETDNTHGAGCTLSSAIACYLAKGHNIEAAVDLAIGYTISTISQKIQIGKGRSPLIHNINLLDNSAFTSTPLP